MVKPGQRVPWICEIPCHNTIGIHWVQIVVALHNRVKICEDACVSGHFLFARYSRALRFMQQHLVGLCRLCLYCSTNFLENSAPWTPGCWICWVRSICSKVSLFFLPTDHFYAVFTFCDFHCFCVRKIGWQIVIFWWWCLLSSPDLAWVS
jgi:hypothetical protein